MIPLKFLITSYNLSLGQLKVNGRLDLGLKQKILMTHPSQTNVYYKINSKSYTENSLLLFGCAPTLTTTNYIIKPGLTSEPLAQDIPNPQSHHWARNQ